VTELRHHGRLARRDDLAVARLAEPLGPPRAPQRFLPDRHSSDVRLAPAAPPRGVVPGTPIDDEEVALAFRGFLDGHLAGNATRIDATMARFASRDARRRLPDAAVRAGFLALTGTLGDPLVEPFLAGELEVDRITFGQPADPGAVVGLVDEPSGDRTRVVAERYRYEMPALYAPALLTALIGHEPAVSDADEAVVNAFAAVVHLQLLGRSPGLAGTTELARRQNSRALALFCSRLPGAPAVRLVVGPDGDGSDFWRLGLADGPAASAPPSDGLARLLDALLPPGVKRPAEVDEDLVEVLDERVLPRELSPYDLLLAGQALSVLA
jgi:hypothetical protein